MLTLLLVSSLSAPRHPAAGCTDAGAENFEPSAAVDSGGCAYNCASLRARLSAPTAARCLIYDAASGTWPPKGPSLAGGSGLRRHIGTGEAWVIQGLPPKGWRRDQPQHEARPSALPPLEPLDLQGSVPSRGGPAWVNLRYINFTSGVPGSSNQGGAINAHKSTVVVDHCLFLGNTVPADGGAIYASTSKFTISRSWFEGNTASYDNGGAVCAKSSTMRIEHTLFSRNSAKGGGGGAILNNNGQLNLTDCWFVSNEAQQDGGAINQHSSEWPTRRARIRDHASAPT